MLAILFGICLIIVSIFIYYMWGNFSIASTIKLFSVFLCFLFGVIFTEVGFEILNIFSENTRKQIEFVLDDFVIFIFLMLCFQQWYLHKKE